MEVHSFLPQIEQKFPRMMKRQEKKFASLAVDVSVDRAFRQPFRLQAGGRNRDREALAGGR